MHLVPDMFIWLMNTVYKASFVVIRAFFLKNIWGERK